MFSTTRSLAPVKALLLTTMSVVLATRGDAFVQKPSARRTLAPPPPYVGPLLPVPTHPVGASPVFIAIGDLDGDSDRDLAVANYDDDTLSVLRNNGGGRLEPAGTYLTGLEPVGVVIGDVDGDSDPDLVAATWGSVSVDVFLNNGSGVFSGPSQYYCGGFAHAIVAGDMDGDTDLDLVVANIDPAGGKLGGSNVSVLLNQGGGSFGSHAEYGDWQDDPNSVALSDLDGDADLDVVATYVELDTVAVFTNAGNGTLAEIGRAHV